MNKEYRIIVNGRDNNVVFDGVVSSRDLADPTEWKELPEALGVKGKIVSVTRDQLLKDVFNIKVADATYPATIQDGDQTIEVTEEKILAKFTDPDTIANLRRLIGVKMEIPEGAFNECVVRQIARANITLPEEDGAIMVDPDNTDNKAVSRDAVEYRLTDAADPYGNKIEPNAEITEEAKKLIIDAIKKHQRQFYKDG